jgi:hypothetical protein
LILNCANLPAQKVWIYFYKLNQRPVQGTFLRSKERIAKWKNLHSSR